MQSLQKISPYLWFSSEAEAAASHYVKAFPGSRITGIQHYPAVGMMPAGSVMTVSFVLAGQAFTALNGGPQFTPTEAVSFSVCCDDQAEVDFLWNHLSDGGSTSMCGWLKDRWGFSWQITPRLMFDIMMSDNAERKARAFAAMLTMTKLDISALAKAADG